MTLVAVFLLSCLSLVIWLVLLFARGGFWRARPARPLPPDAAPSDWPAVAAVVPARNEADVIGEAVTSLIGQQYPGPFHLIVVDDHSTDGTAAAARAAGKKMRARFVYRVHALRVRAARGGFARRIARAAHRFPNFSSES
ncbi:Glycosyl transferase, family 2 [Burkholderia singularis]|uniref:Glycosyl transferase, family 2 n=1 Tax=Burkholderia singularis TaxID=1503053 RepID=A0A238H1G7_9BURK|nr:glycosyltransferase [Burkholderia singularis]SMF99085.1 Glycosyl transferase, family 2 [Burkholderia singularis]